MTDNNPRYESITPLERALVEKYARVTGIIPVHFIDIVRILTVQCRQELLEVMYDRPEEPY